MGEASTTTADLLAHAAWVRSLARQLVLDAGEAEDLAQEALLRTLQHPPREPRALRSFLRRVLHNAWREGRRGAGRRRERERGAARAEGANGPDALAERLSTHRRVVEAVQRLDEPFRSAILLRFFEELPPRAIARRLGVPVKTVDSRVQRGLARLRDDLDQRSGERRAWAAAVLALARDGGAAPARPMLAPWALASCAAALAAVSGWALLARGVPRAAAGPGVAAARADAPPPRAELAASAAAAAERRPLATALDGALRGTVVDGAGAPVPGARVEAFEQPLAGFDVRVPEFADAERSVAAAETDAEGRFALAVPAGLALLVRASAPGLGVERRGDARAGDTLALALRRASSLELQASRGGGPAVGAALELLLQGVSEPVWRGAADEHGRATAAGLTPGIYTVECTPRDAPRTFALDVPLEPGGTASVELESPAGASLLGRVVAARTGLPVAGARVTGSRAAEVRSDAQGRFELRGLPLDPSTFPAWTVSVQAEGCAPYALRVDAAAPPEGELPLVVEPEARLAGALVDELGAPVSGAWIACAARGARSDASGRFEVGGLAPAAPLAVWIRAPGRATRTEVLPEGIAAGRRDLGTLALQPGLSVRGTARTAAGEPVAEATVELQRLSPPGGLPAGESSPGQVSRVTVDSGEATPASAIVPAQREFELELERCARRRARTNADGAFRCDDLEPGRYRIVARKNGLGPAAALERELAAGAPPLELLFAAGPAVAGRVRGSDGAPLANAWLLVHGEGAQAGGPAQLSALDGSFVLCGVPSSPFELEVSYHGTRADGEYRYLRARLRALSAPLSGLEVVLPRNLPVEGVLLGEGGEPEAGRTVRAEDADGRVTTAETDGLGRFRVGAAEGGSVDLTTAGPGAPPAELRGVPAGSTGVTLRATGR